MRATPAPAVLILSVLAVVAAALLIVALWRIGDGLAEQACVAKAEARYPAVPVSAVSGNATGPLKLSFVAERTRAVAAC